MFSKNIKYLRTKYDYDQVTLAAKLGKKGGTSVANWEKGTATPPVGVLSDMAHLFNVTIDQLMNEDLQKGGSLNIDYMFKQLTIERQHVAYDFVKDQLQDQNNKVVSLPTQDDAVQLQANGVLSAGVGEFLDDSTETFPVTVRKPIPKCYDYIFKVNGHSMEPTFEDGQVIFVTKHEDYRSGQLIAIVVDGCAYVKRLRYNDDEMTLVSLNPDYPNVQVLKDDNYEILGVAFA